MNINLSKAEAQMICEVLGEHYEEYDDDQKVTIDDILEIVGSY